MGTEHRYEVIVEWTGNQGSGTSGYRAYERSHVLRAAGKSSEIAGSSDPAFRGDRSRWNPEELLVGSLSACHKLWYLHVCAIGKVTVIAYTDSAEGFMAADADGGGQFSRVVLRPEVTIAAGSDPARAAALHEEAHRMCFIARSVNFPVIVEPSVRVGA